MNCARKQNMQNSDYAATVFLCLPLESETMKGNIIGSQYSRTVKASELMREWKVKEG